MAEGLCDGSDRHTDCDRSSNERQSVPEGRFRRPPADRDRAEGLDDERNGAPGVAFLNDGDKFGRAHVWHYVQGKALPRTKYLEALSQALDVRPDELMPAEIGADHPEPGAREEQLVVAPPAAAREGENDSADGMVHVRDYGDGTALLEVSQRVSWETAITVLRMLKAPTEA